MPTSSQAFGHRYCNGFAMTAFSVILAIRARADLGHDHVHSVFQK